MKQVLEIGFFDDGSRVEAWWEKEGVTDLVILRVKDKGGEESDVFIEYDALKAFVEELKEIAPFGLVTAVFNEPMLPDNDPPVIVPDDFSAGEVDKPE